MRKVEMPIRQMCRVSSPGTKHQYQVFEQQADGSWKDCSPIRPHSTTAFADLGRLTHNSVKQALADMGETTPAAV